MKDEQWQVININALGTIQLFLEMSIDFNISNENTMTNMMQALAKLYKKPSTSNKVFLMKHFFNMKMLKGGSIIDHLIDFKMFTDQLSFVGVNFDDEIRDILI